MEDKVIKARLETMRVFDLMDEKMVEHINEEYLNRNYKQIDELANGPFYGHNVSIGVWRGQNAYFFDGTPPGETVKGACGNFPCTVPFSTFEYENHKEKCSSNDRIIKLTRRVK